MKKVNKIRCRDCGTPIYRGATQNRCYSCYCARYEALTPLLKESPNTLNDGKEGEGSKGEGSKGEGGNK